MAHLPVFLFVVSTVLAEATAQNLETVATGSKIWSGVTTTPDGRIFVALPNAEGIPGGLTVAEIKPGNKLVPYPNQVWNSYKNGSNNYQHKFVKAVVVRFETDGLLWVLDCGIPVTSPILPNGATKFVLIDIATNRVVRIIPLDSVALLDSTTWANFRIFGDTIYLTDQGTSPAIAVLDKVTGTGRRILESSSYVMPSRSLFAEGKELKIFGNPAMPGVNQLDVSPDGSLLYFQTPAGPMYRVETQFLLDTTLDDSAIGDHVEVFFDSPSTAGLAIDTDGHLYLSDVNHQQILRITPAAQSSVVVQSKNLTWSDALWMDNDGNLWMPVGQINRIPVFQNGVNKVKLPVKILKLAISGAQGFRS